MKIYTVHIQNYSSDLVPVPAADVPRDLGPVAKDEQVMTRRELTQNEKLETAIFVPETFSWVAIIFPLNIISAVMARNWAFLMILLTYFVTAVAQFHDKQIDGVISAIKLGFFPFLGVWANDLLRVSLKHQGYHLAGIVSGRNESEAQLRFFEEVAGHKSVGNVTNFHA